MSRFRKALESLRDINLLDIGRYLSIDDDKVDECASEEQRALIEELAPDGWISVVEMQRNSLEDFVDMWSSREFYDEYELEEMMQEVIKPAKHYLVMAHNCRWNGASGYKVADSLPDTIRRDYDTYICPQEASSGGKTLICTEYSHDVPMGARTSIIALTEREYEFINHWDTSFEAVERFAAACEAKAV